MACCPTEKSYGYESGRFEKDVDENFICSICYNVLKDPRTCRNNDHMFCLVCITEHLTVNSQTCPECNEYLSVDTLRRPRVVNNILAKLKIKCDYASRGCPEFVCVEELQTHVENCGFAPVLCSNEECGMEINKQDKVHHETEVCEYRKVKCHDCGQIQEVVGRLEENIVELDKKVKIARAETRREVEVLNKEVKEVRKEVRDVKEKMETVRREMKNEMNEMKEELSRVNKNVEEVKVMMIQMSEKINLLELLKKLPSPSEGMMSTSREYILIAGGSGPSTSVKQIAEIYSWEKNDWFKVSKMNEEHRGASSFIYKDQLFVVGGDHSKTIESLNLNESPLKWMKFPSELPYACDDHQTVVYQQRIIHIGGYNYDKFKLSNVISELQLSSPCTMKQLCQMPEPRQYHGAEMFEDKVIIMGGEKINGCFALDCVLEFDLSSNKCKEMRPLPHALKKMASVRWRDKVVVLGGQNKDGKVLNDVFMYDCKTGKITTLPSMLEKRSGCCAVIIGNTIVAMGGRNENTLNSVECFTMGGSTWEYLPAMNEARWEAIAEVLPHTRKYV